MSEALWLLLAAALSFSGMAWLALAMGVHWSQVMQQPAHPSGTTREGLRVLGAGALLLSLLVCLTTDRPSMAVLVWVMLLIGCAVAVAMVLSWRAHWLRPLALTKVKQPSIFIN